MIELPANADQSRRLSYKPLPLAREDATNIAIDVGLLAPGMPINLIADREGWAIVMPVEAWPVIAKNLAQGACGK